MLSNIEVTYFRSRIDDILREGQPTEWQRQFLLDMHAKISRYGSRTRLTDKQLAILRRLTRIAGDADLRLVTENRPAHIERRQYWFRGRSHRSSYLHAKLIAFAIILVAVLIGHAFQSGMDFLGRSSSEASVSMSPVSQFSTQGFSITDGDTVRMSDGTPVRLVGFNAPEIFHPQCDSEAALGRQATELLKQLVASGSSTVTRIACSCKRGTEGTARCNYGRSCGILKVDGQDVAQTLIGEGLAVPFVCSGDQCPPTPRPWCG